MMMKMKGMCAIHKAAWVLVIVGALNWGLVGLLQLDLVMKLLGGIPLLMRAVYVLVGVSGLAMLGIGKCCMKDCKCGDDGCSHCGMDEKKPMAPAGEQKM
jgi:uncharacterized membrane protein YuzA (DUF378 family)